MREAVVLLTPIDLNHRAKEVPPGTTEAAVYRMIAFLSAACRSGGRRIDGV